MVKRTLMTERNIKTPESDDFRLKYYLLSQKSLNEFSNEARGGQAYGLSIEKEILQKGNVVKSSYDAAPGITYSKSEAEGLIETLAQMLVTPMSLVDIIDDYISARDNNLSLGQIEQIAN